MLKPWSITTTVRNPERLRNFLVALQPLAGKEWNGSTQEKYQKLLIKNRLYGYGNQQFYTGLPRDIINLVSNLDLEIDDVVVERIVDIKKYRDFDMRGRQSINPLTKLGFVMITNGIVSITGQGQKLIASDKDAGDVFLRAFIKWQIPNPANDDYSSDGNYDIVPFVATLKLISEVNRLEIERGNKGVGISKREFCLFVPTLVRYDSITEQAIKIISFRDLQKGKSSQDRKNIRDEYRLSFAKSFLNSHDQTQINKLLENLKDYGDNAIRYFRLTKFIRIRGNGFYVDLEPSRDTEIKSLFENEFYKPKIFDNREDYLTYMSDYKQPSLPWYTKSKLEKIAVGVYSEVKQLQLRLGLAAEDMQSIDKMPEDKIAIYIEKLRAERKYLQEKDNHAKSQPVQSITNYIDQLENIYELEDRALALEYFSAMGLHALNDAVEIRPNYPVGDDNEPTTTAPGGMADIECYYDDFSMICEVTMLRGRDQWFNEGQPVMRHLREFEMKNKNAFCIFIAPSVHTDSAETFWLANTFGYKGSKQRIAPITIVQFVKILKTLKNLREANRKFTHENLQSLIRSIVDNTENFNNSDEWVEGTQRVIDTWSAHLLASSSTA
jgi:hypothetical protein